MPVWAPEFPEGSALDGRARGEVDWIDDVGVNQINQGRDRGSPECLVGPVAFTGKLISVLI